MYVSSRLSVARDVGRKTNLYKAQQKYHIIQNADTAQTNPTGLLRPRTHIPVMQCLQKPRHMAGFFYRIKSIIIIFLKTPHYTLNLAVA